MSAGGAGPVSISWWGRNFECQLVEQECEVLRVGGSNPSDATEEYASGLNVNFDQGWYEFVCPLANVAAALQSRFDDLDFQYDLGPIDLNISGCMNACGHHHIGHIGILGVDKKGQEFYQVSLGGHGGKDASLGKILGPSFKRDDMPDIIDKVLGTYLDLREGEETFLDTYRRAGMDPFKERVYAKAD